MHKIKLPLLHNYDRPTISLYSVNALIDSGAVPLILNLDDRTVKEFFGGKDTGKVVSVKGIGQTDAKVYVLEHFCIGDMVFRDFPALVCPLKDETCPIIIGCSMYSRGSKCLIDTEKDEVTFEFTEVFFRAGKPCIRRKGEWGFLDFKDGKYIALTITT